MCVIGIANSPVGVVLLYEKDVQQRVIELGLNGATGFRDGFWQMSIILWIQGLSKAWEIPGTEDLKPYIPVKVMIGKWFGTVGDSE